MRNAKMTLAVGAVCCGVSCSASMAMDLSLNRAVEMIVDQSQDIKKADAALKQAEGQ